MVWFYYLIIKFLIDKKIKNIFPNKIFKIIYKNKLLFLDSISKHIGLLYSYFNFKVELDFALVHLWHISWTTNNGSKFYEYNESHNFIRSHQLHE